MARETVIAIMNIKRLETVVVHAGLARAAFEGERLPTVHALTDIAKGEVAIYEPANRTIKRKE